MFVCLTTLYKYCIVVLTWPHPPPPPRSGDDMLPYYAVAGCGHSTKGEAGSVVEAKGDRWTMSSGLYCQMRWMPCSGLLSLCGLHVSRAHHLSWHALCVCVCVCVYLWGSYRRVVVHTGTRCSDRCHSPPHKPTHWLLTSLWLRVTCEPPPPPPDRSTRVVTRVAGSIIRS